MPQYDLDLFVIGAGSGGVRAARIAAQHGARVAVAEDYRIGGTCVVRGCIPKKIMVLSSRFHDAWDDARGFGWSFPAAPEFSWPALRDAKDREIARLSKVYEDNLLGSGVAIHRTRAVLDDPHTVRFADGSRSVTAAHILVATGSHPVHPDIPGCELGISSNEAFDLPELPKRILIVGGGYIALEFGCLFQRLGAAVTICYHGSKVLRGFDEDVRDEMMLALATEGTTLKMDDEIATISEGEGGVRNVAFTSGQTEPFDLVFFATGRRASTAGMGLAEAGVDLAADGSVKVDATSKSSVDHIYAVGDVTNRLQLTPVAIREGHAVADSLFGKKPWQVDHSLVATAVFSTPEVGTVGLSEAAARAGGRGVDIYRARFRSLKHTLTRRQERTLMKIVVEQKTDKVLGVHIVGEDAGEMIQLAAIPLVMGATKADFDRAIAVHPTAAEELVTLRTKVPAADPGAA
ncbi:MAG TPA: glutathione-disulfide reductase [Hyphomicrobiales bacterium]|nr:glutathione-disulfide reductase [Hyphomicrobiales bacterium]